MLAVDRYRQDLLDIVAGASTVSERLNGGFVPDDASAGDEVVKVRLERWCQLVAGGDKGLFKKLLARDGLTIDEAQRVLGSVKLSQDAPVPSWAHMIDEVLSFTDALRSEGTDGNQISASGLLDASQFVPFGEVVVPFVLIARQRLREQCAEVYQLLSDEAHLTLQRDLLHSLVSTSLDTLQLEFSTMPKQDEEDEWTVYRRFVSQLHSEKLAAFFRKYTVLARLLSTVTLCWLEDNVELLKRLASDRSAIREVFGQGDELGQVVAVEPSLGGSHHGRRTVMALSFTSGRKLIYKSRNIGLEEAYHQLLAWCNERGILLPFKVLACLNRSSYGWVEHVQRVPCRDQQEVRRYYQRTGMLLCLVYVLGGMDCSADSLIASGEYPILVDPGVLLHHYPHAGNLSNGASIPLGANQQHLYSVLHTGLLPTWQVMKGKQKAKDASGLGSPGGSVSIPKQEAVPPKTATKKLEAHANTPTLDDIPLRIEDYVEDVVEGFHLLYNFLLNHREVLLAPFGPLNELAQQEVCFIYRPAWRYKEIRQKLLTPALLDNGVDRSIQLQELAWTAIPFEGQLWNQGDSARWWPVLLLERQALERGEMPAFTARANSTALMVNPGREIADCFQEPGFDLALRRIEGLCHEDLQRQASFMQAALYSSLSDGATTLLQMGSVDASTATNGLPPMKGLVEHALSIAEQIAARAMHMVDGSTHWLLPEHLSRSKRYQLHPMRYHLFKGSAGIVLFLAALEKVTGEAGYRKLALATVQPLHTELEQKQEQLAEEMGIGGALGLGSVVYALTRASQFLDEPRLLDDARRAARLISAKLIADDKALDVIAGAAGAILGLMALYEATGEEEILGRAMICGRHLLDARVTGRTGYRAWPTLAGQCTTGFSHGAAGIAYALLRLYGATRERGLLEAAAEGIAYENSLFSSEVGNWSELPGEKPEVTTWCHGAPGIGLARVGGLSFLDTPQIRRDIDIALQTTRRCSLYGSDHLCCGNLGRADILLTASRRLFRPELAEEAGRNVWQVVKKAEQRGSFRVTSLLPDWVYMADFFQGMAGVGYELLRFARPETLPSVLLWE